MLMCKRSGLATMLLLLWLCCIGSAQAEGTAPPSSILMEAPDGYVEITPEAFPDYTWAIAGELKEQDLIFHRLFLRQEELPFLQRGEFARITGGVMLLEPGDIPELKNFDWPDLSDAKAFFKSTDKDIDGAAVSAWISSTAKEKKSLRFGPFAGGKDFSVFTYLSQRSPLITYGLYPNRDGVRAIIPLRVHGQLFLMFFYKNAESVADVKAVTDIAVAYMQDGKRIFPKADMPVLRNNADLFCVPMYVAKTYAEQGKIDQAKALYTAIYDRYYEEDEGMNESSLRAVLELATLHAQQKEYEQAEQLLVRTLAEAEKSLGAANRMVVLLKAKLGDLYTATGNTAKAARIMEAPQGGAGK